MQLIIHCLRVSCPSSLFENLAADKTKVLSEIQATAEVILSKIEYLRLPFNPTGATIYEYLLLCLRLRDLLEKRRKITEEYKNWGNLK